MRIEILVDNEDPQIFPLNNSKITIGSHESCEIQLHTDGVSRKHLQVITEDDKYYVVDQGSTNGTYINEERLVPGRRAEFTSFFPVRMGDKVLMTLLSDADASDLGYSDELMPKPEASSPSINRPSQQDMDSTRTISLRDLQSVKTVKLVQKREETVKKRKSAPASQKKAPIKDQRRMMMVKFFSLLIVGSAAYYNFVVLKPEPEVAPAPVKKIGEVLKVQSLKPMFAQVEKADLTPHSRFPEMGKEITCTGDLEAFFCKLYQEKGIKNYGVLQIGTMINSMVDGKAYLERARTMLPRPQPLSGNTELTPEQTLKFENDVAYTAMVLFLNDLPVLDLEMIKDLNLTFSLLITDVNIDPKYIAVAFVPASFNAFKERLKEPTHFEYTKKNGAEAIYFLKNYFTYY